MLKATLPLLGLVAAADAMRVAPMPRTSASASSRVGVRMGLQFNEETAMAGDPNAANYRKLSDALREADVERRKEEEEAAAAIAAEEEKRNRRRRKIEAMHAIPDNAPAGRVRGRPRVAPRPRPPGPAAVGSPPVSRCRWPTLCTATVSLRSSISWTTT